VSADIDAGVGAGAFPELGAESLEDYSVCPEDLVDQEDLSLDGRDEIRDDDEDDRPVASWRALDYPEPEPHGQGIMAVLEDLDDSESAYRRLWKGWRDHVGDPDQEPYVLLEDAQARFDWLPDDESAHLILKSKPWKACEELVDGEIRGRRYEYSIQLMPYDPEDDELDPDSRLPVSFQMWVQPQSDDLVGVRSGEPFSWQYGEGTKFKLQTTYATPSECVRRLVEVANAGLEALDRDRPDWSVLNRESLKIWKAEMYHRIDSELMSAVVQRLRGLRTIVEHGGTGDVHGSSEYYQGAHVEEVVVSDMWDRAGYIGEFARQSGYNLGLKIYRIAGNPSDERLKHPKVEAFLEGTDNETSLPHIDDWSALRATLRQMASSLSVRSGASLGQLREDDFYTVGVVDRVDTLIPTGWRDAQRLANQERERRILEVTYEALSLAKWDILYSVAMLDGATYDQLEEFTGYSRDYVREVVRELKERDILLRLTYPRVIVFRNEELRLNAAEKLQEVEPGRDMSDVRADADDRRERRSRLQEETDDDQEDVDVDDGLQEESVDESSSTSSSSSDWLRVDQLDFSAEAIGRYLERGDIAAVDAKIRTSPYDWLD